MVRSASPSCPAPASECNYGSGSIRAAAPVVPGAPVCGAPGTLPGRDTSIDQRILRDQRAWSGCAARLEQDRDGDSFHRPSGLSACQPRLLQCRRGAAAGQRLQAEERRSAADATYRRDALVFVAPAAAVAAEQGQLADVVGSD